MNPECGPFRAELERALAGPSAARAALARHAHALACASCRAELAREERLERLLARVPAPEVPPALARRVLAGLATARAVGTERDEVDRLLGSLPAPRIPPDLAASVLAGLAPARAARSARRPRRRWLLVAAAAVVLIAWTLWARRPEPAEPEDELARAATALEADEELLAYALEHWELLHDEDLDVWLASLDPVDEFLMEVADDASWLAELEAATEGGGR